MSTDYKNLFKGKRDYSNLFSESQKQNSEQEDNMSYKNLFTNSPPATPKVTPKFPAKDIDPRVTEIQEVDPKISTYAVIKWMDNFDENLKKLSTVNQSVSEQEIDLAMDFTNGRLAVQNLFNQIKAIVAKLKGPEKKTGFLSRILGSDEEFKLTPELISEVIQGIKSCMEQFKNKAKYNTSMFLKAEMRKIEVSIKDLRSDLECARVACIVMMKDENDFKAPVRMEKVKQMSSLIDLSELQLNNSYKLLEKDIESYENLKDMTVPFLYVKIQSLMSGTLDNEALNLINDIDKL